MDIHTIILSALACFAWGFWCHRKSEESAVFLMGLLGIVGANIIVYIWGG